MPYGQACSTPVGIRALPRRPPRICHAWTVPTSPAPAEGPASTDDTGPMPASVRVAVIVMSLLAGLLLLITALNLYVLEERVEGSSPTRR